MSAKKSGVATAKDRKRVTKEWGYEDFIVNRPDYCGKRLILKKGFRSSLHYHKIKHETFYLQSGLVQLELGGEKFILKPGDSVRVTRRCTHRFSGLKRSVLFEFSTHDEPSDTYRIRGQLSGPMPG